MECRQQQQQQVVQPQFLAVGLILLEQETEGGEADVFRLLARDEMDEDWGRDECEPAEKIGVEKRHRSNLKGGIAPTFADDELFPSC